MKSHILRINLAEILHIVSFDDNAILMYVKPHHGLGSRMYSLTFFIEITYLDFDEILHANSFLMTMPLFSGFFLYMFYKFI